ncbi:MAG TPA: c-type cytochrome [Acidobacteriaceae bacterium]|jgi:cytochrome c oxidase cbb3-type subunit III|nr:c-type cytochrome [Acidobacteriaceae bacterium]
MRLRTTLSVAALALAAILAGCDRAPGDAKIDEYTPPDQVTDFHTLYATNCQACHGANGQGGPAMDLGNPEYQALVDDATLKKWISNGMPGTEMPAFAQSAGGMLTDQQVDAIAAGMRREWRKPNVFGGETPPPYAQPDGGNAAHGQQVYQARCASCHQNPGRQQVTSPVYLSLVSDQALRTIIVAGRPDIGQPDWRLRPTPAPGSPPAVYAYLVGPPLASQDVTDLVTYLHSLRSPSAVSAAPTKPAQQ